ncbi:MAG: hypothetical protein LBH91_00515 [Prevotellaceae bacterium]|jgi:hypothetical protein|nr:hypothetical protein [Prevotellaceae bacterium]
MPAKSITAEITNNPEASVYADLLIQINPESAEYTDFNESNGQLFDISYNSAIAQYAENGFASFTFHYLGSASNIVLSSNANGSDYLYADFTRIANDDSQFNNISANYHVMKIALLDKSGNILKISDVLDINPKKTGYFTGHLYYDANSGEAKAGYFERSAFFGVFYLFLILFIPIVFPIIISIAIELVIALPFRIKPVRKVLIMNIITQIILVVFMSFCRLPYIQTLIIIEIFVYLSEFGAYTLLFKNISKLRLMLYTIFANTASLAIGILLNTYELLSRL